MKNGNGTSSAREKGERGEAYKFNVYICEGKLKAPINFCNRIKNDRHHVELCRQRKARIGSWNSMLVDYKTFWFRAWVVRFAKDFPSAFESMRNKSLWNSSFQKSFHPLFTSETRQIEWISIPIWNYGGSHHPKGENDCDESFCVRRISITLTFSPTSFTPTSHHRKMWTKTRCWAIFNSHDSTSYTIHFQPIFRM